MLEGLNYTWNSSITQTKLYVYTRTEQESQHPLPLNSQLWPEGAYDNKGNELPFHVPLQMCERCCKVGHGGGDGADKQGEIIPSAVLHEVRLNKGTSREVCHMLQFECVSCDSGPGATQTRPSKKRVNYAGQG